MKEYLFLASMVTLWIIVMVLAVWLWWFADCELLKQINYSIPGRCI